jgi:hypothetical protein
MKVHRVLLMITPALIISLGYCLLALPHFRVKGQSGCYTPPVLTNRFAWAKDAMVRFYIDPNLSTEKKAAIEEVLNNWNNA